VIGEPLDDLVFGARVARESSVVVPAYLVAGARIPADDPRGGWIPGLNDDPPSCGEHRQLPNVYAEEWCLRPEAHEGECFR
jgi:hypothetical protein